MKRLLVTGASGLLGLNLVMQAGKPGDSGNHWDVYGVLRREPFSPPAGLPFTPVLGDLLQPRSIEQMLDQAQPDAVIHCAALTDVDYCEANPAEAAEVNARLPGRIAQETARRGIQLMHISTDAVFDGLKGDYSETDEPNPLNVYGQTKLEGERLVAAADPNALIARVNFYGWSWQGRRSLAEWFFNQLSAGNRVYGFTDILFCPLLVNHMVDILLMMIERRMNGLYHVVSSECLSKYNFGVLLARQFGFAEDLIAPSCYKTGSLKAPRSRRLTLNAGKLSAALGASLPDQEAGMKRFYGLYCQGHPQLLRSMFTP